MSIRYPEGISLLVPVQNCEKTIDLCIRSFRHFADEIIAVANGSTDSSVARMVELEKEIPNLEFYNVPDLPDLYQNRQFALEKSKFSWIVRIDSDHIAYTEGPNDIQHLRERIFNTPKSLRPVSYGISQVSLYHDYWHSRIHPSEWDRASEITDPDPLEQLPARIIRRYPLMKFMRLGRWEGVRFQKYLKHIQLQEPYWFHCQFKKGIDYLFRSERTNWRELGDYGMYPTLETYVGSIIESKYGTADLDEAAVKYMEQYYFPLLRLYRPEKHYPYPSLIREAMGKTEPLISINGDTDAGK